MVTIPIWNILLIFHILHCIYISISFGKFRSQDIRNSYYMTVPIYFTTLLHNTLNSNLPLNNNNSDNTNRNFLC